MPEGKDKRHFRRYLKHSEADIIAGEARFKGEMVDYSFDGVRAVFNERHHVKVGDLLSLSFSDPEINSSGEVVWAMKSEGQLSVGIRRIGVLSGRLGDFNLSDIMLGFQRARKTGVLHVTHSLIRKTIYIEDGVMVFAESNDPVERLGQILLSSGAITPEQYEISGELVRKSGRRQGAALVELGYLSPGELVEAVTEQVTSIIQSLFGLESGNFLFKEGPLPSEEVVKLKLPAGNIIYWGIKKYCHPGSVVAIFPAPESVLYFSPDPLNLFQHLELDEEDRDLLRLINGKRTFKNVVSDSAMEESSAKCSLLALLSTMIIEVLDRPEGDLGINAERVFAEHPRADAKEAVEMIEKMYGEYESLGYYGVLGLAKKATGVEIKRAYYEKARQFHPDRHFDLAEDVKDKINVIFTYITEAYSVLISSQLRRQYEDMPKSANETRGISKDELALERFGEGLSAMKDANFPDAAKLFGAAAYLKSKVPKYHYFASMAFSKNGQLKDAERALNRALRLDPFNPSYLTEAGYIFMGLEMPLRARGNFEKALKLRPNNMRAQEGIKLLEKLNITPKTPPKV